MVIYLNQSSIIPILHFYSDIIPMELKTIVEKSEKLSLPPFQHSIKVPSSTNPRSPTRPNSALAPAINNKPLPIIYLSIAAGSTKHKSLNPDSPHSWVFLTCFFPKNNYCLRCTKNKGKKFPSNFSFFLV